MNMSVSDLTVTIRATLRDLMPHVPADVIDQITSAVAQRIADRESQFRPVDIPADRAELLDRLERERYTPLPRREVAVSRPNDDTPEVVAARLAILAEMPVSEADA